MSRGFYWCPTHLQLAESKLKRGNWGVPIVAQWVKSLISIHEDAGSLSGLAQWVKALALP